MQLPALAGDGPWQIPLDTTSTERQAMLQRLAVDGARDPAIRRVASTIAALADCAVCCAPDKVLASRAAMALAFVHTLKWNPTPGEIYQSAGRTLRVGGTCHDFSVVYVALLLALGVPRAIVTWLNQRDAPLNHVLAQLDLGDGWCWAETTVPGALVCEDPYDAERRLDGGRHLAGHALPYTVHAPRAIGQTVADAIDAAAPLGKPVASSTSAADRPRIAHPAPLAARAGHGTTHVVDDGTKASAGIATDPCAAHWRIVVGARAEVQTRALSFPHTGRFMLRTAGRELNPAGASSGYTCGSWMAVATRERRTALARFGSTRGDGAGPPELRRHARHRRRAAATGRRVRGAGDRRLRRARRIGLHRARGRCVALGCVRHGHGLRRLLTAAASLWRLAA
jgi:hypothetical protein